MKINVDIGKQHHNHYNDLYGHALTSEPQPWGHEIYNFDSHPSLVIITVNNVLSLSDLCLIFKEIHQFYTFYPKIISHWGGGYKIFNFLSSNSTYASYLIWFRLA